MISEFFTHQDYISYSFQYNMARRFTLKKNDSPSDLQISYADELNPQQYRAATASSGSTLIVAGAGTGKTRTLIYRLAYLVETGTHPENIVLLTFTRRAASDMLARAEHLLDGRCRRVRGGTFHSFCLSILRRYATKLDFPNNFTILDASDAADVCSVIRTSGNYHKGEKRFPQKKTIYNMISASKNRDSQLREILVSQYAQFINFTKDLEEIASAYSAYKKEHALMDFDDLLVHTLELFEQDEEVEREVSARCRHVLVDEYQDTNAIQARLVNAFCEVHGNVTAVGDDAQSIYRFRGANLENIFAFPEQFEDTRILKLEQNYRSTQPILTLANHVIEQADRSYEKELFTDEEGGDIPAIVAAEDDAMEARFVTQMILHLREQGVPLNDMAVLFRSSHHAYDVEVELGRRGIPFVKYGGMKLNEAAHVKDVLAHLKVAENPQDAASWNRILQLLYGVGPKTSSDLISWITEEGDGPFTFQEQRYSPRYIESLRELFQLLKQIHSGDMPVSEQVERVLQYYQPILEKEYYEDFPKREQDLDHLVSLANGYDSRAAMLSDLALDPIELTALDSEESEEDEPPLVLSTIHSAKGLEFHSVFIIKAVEGSLPSQYAFEDPEEMDEELRLFYVAVTRAEEQLFISYPILRYERFRREYVTDPSRFVADVPDSVLEPLQLLEEEEEEEAPQLTRGEESTQEPVQQIDDQLPF